MAQDITIQSLDPISFEYQTYSNADSQLIVQSQLDTVFSDDTDYIEYYVYDQNKTLIFPSQTTPLLYYNVRNGDVELKPDENLEVYGFDLGTYNILYTFYRKRLASNISEKYFISNISSDRTEIRLDSNIISNDLIISSSNSFIQYRENADYFVDFFLNFGLNQTVIANNIKLETEEGIDPTVIIKLYEPLPSNFSLKDELWIVEELSIPQAYEVNFPFVAVIEDDFTFISGPNYNLNITQETSAGTDLFSFDTLLQSDVTSSINQIQNLINQKEVNINVNYEKYGNFVNFSSAKTRLDNFFAKVGLIESASNQIVDILSPITSDTRNTTSFSSSKALYTSQIDTIIKNFDGYEYFLYFNSGSDSSYPKFSFGTPPFTLYPTGSSTAGIWLQDQSLIATNYDQNNRDWLYWSIPEYLREDPANQGYELFVDMVAQYYDNVWLYTKDISNKFDADNRLEYGISKDLVADAIRDFGVKLYSSNFNTNDLFTAFLGLTPSGSAFPFPELTGSVVDGSGDLSIPSGFGYVDTKISASNDIVPLNDVQKQVYKRVYHNIPYLLKTKGTVAGIRALITSYGIPDTILRISEFGGKDRNESQDYDLKQDVFNYAFDTGASATNFVSSSLQANTKFPVNGSINKAEAVQLRFKPSEIPLPTNNVANSNIRYSQSLWSTDDGGNLLLEYTGSGFVTGSYSGSIANPYDTYGTLKFVPAQRDNPALSASVYLPFFNGDWWSVQINVGGPTPTASLYSANEIDGKIGFNESSSTVGFDASIYFDATTGFLNKDTNTVFTDGTTYTPFSGSFQELRYYINEISQSNFYDYTVNPYSNEGNGINSTPDQQFFRAALGTQLDTGSRISIHPRVTGSAVQITQSFATNSEFYINSSRFVTNVEDIFQDQVPAGIKNRITNKIQLENLILAEAPYGFQTPTSSKATISSTGNDTTTISALESVQTTSFLSQSYTPNVNYLEVAFSPSNQINDDINAQLGYFNLGDYIGDPRFISSSDYSYPNLNRLRDSYFEKYIRGYDVVDFIRLIKFFDNSLFKMIKDFTPARTSLASGVVVKQHLLERNRQRPAQATSSIHNYEGLVVNLPKDYSSGSTDFPQYSTEGSAIYKFSGGPGGSFNRFNGLSTYPSGSKGLGPDNRFNLTQSWSESADYSVIDSLNFNQSNSFFISASGGAGKYPGRSVFEHSDQSEFYDGIFSGSNVQVTDQILNPGCTPYLTVTDTPINYRVLFFGFDDVAFGSVTSDSFRNRLNTPDTGDAWIGSSINSNNIGSVKVIKLANTDLDGNIVGDYVQQNTKIEIILPDSNLSDGRTSAEYFITGVVRNSTNVVLSISNALDAEITGSNNGGSNNFTVVDVRGDYNVYTGDDLTSQNAFLNPSLNTQTQNIFSWNDKGGNPIPDNPRDDNYKYFNTGSTTVTTSNILDGTGNTFNHGAYNLGKTPNIPLFFSCSISYSGSQLGAAGTDITGSGVYSSGSSFLGSMLPSQNWNPKSSGFLTKLSSEIIPPPFFEDVSNNSVFFSPVSRIIAGNSASWYAPTSPQGPKPDPGNFAGNSQLKNEGTSSLEWSFPTFTFDAFTPTQLAFTNTPTPFSGSTTSTFNPTNVDFDYDITSIASSQQVSDPLDSVDFLQRKGLDGAVSISLQLYFTWLNLVAGAGNLGQPFAKDYSCQSVEYIVKYTVIAPTGTDFGAGIYGLYQAFPRGTIANPTTSASLDSMETGTNKGSFGTDATSLLNPKPALSFESGTSGRWEVTQSISLDWTYGPFGAPGSDESMDPSAGNLLNCHWIKPYLQGNASANVDYKIEDFIIDAVLVAPFLTTLTPRQTPFQVTNNQALNGIFCATDEPSVPIPNNNSSVYTRFPVNNFTLSPINDGGQSTSKINLISTAPANPNWVIQVTPQLYKLSASVADADNDDGRGPKAIVVGAPLLIGEGGTVKINGNGISNNTSTYTADFTTQNFSPKNLYNPNHTSNGDYNATPVPGQTSPKYLYTGSTLNSAGDIYYTSYSMSGFLEGNPANAQNVLFTFNNGSDLGNYAIISQSVSDLASNALMSASINILQGKASTPNEQGSVIVSELALVDGAYNSLGRVAITGSIDLQNHNYDVNDTFRMQVSVEKGFGNGLTITEYSMSIFNSSSQWAPFNDTTRMNDGTLNLGANNFRIPLSSPFIITTFYGNGILPFRLALDCQPLLNNYSAQRPNPYLMDVDYNFQSNTRYYSSSLAPVNFIQILSGSAVRATVPVSNYTQKSFINPRYNGVKSTSARLNVWSVGDTGTYGKNPTVELRDAYFGYFNDLSDPYPNINNLTRVNLNYLIDEQGNALPPSIQPLSIDTFKSVFPNTSLGKLAVKDGDNKFRTLGEPAGIERIMQYVTPIIYSQNSSNNYTNTLPLSGSGYISRYDNDDADAMVFAKFQVAGTSSIDTSTQQQSVDYYIDPSEAVAPNTPGLSTNPWNVGNETSAAYTSGVWGSTAGDLSNEQIVSVQTSLLTSYVSETKRTRDELNFEFHMYSGQSGTDGIDEKAFNLEDITCKVYTDDGRVTNIGSVLEYGWFNITNVVNYEKVLKRRNGSFWRKQKWIYSRIPVPTGGISCTADWEMFETLFDLGLMRERFPKNGSGVKALEWIITANSGAYTIQKNDKINFRAIGSFKNSRSSVQQGYFFPQSYEGAFTPAIIQGVGAYDHLSDEANKAQAPFWVFTGSTGNGTAIIDQTILVMSSSNMNEAYGTSYRQGDLEYFPGASDYFPGGVEPRNTSFDDIQYPIELQEGDEIRFSNNENFTYTIIEVYAPSENVEDDNKARLKIKLDGVVPTSVNKDFFLARRPIVNPNSLYLNTPFPYETLSSSSIGTFITAPGASGSFALTSSITLPSGSSDDGSYTASFSSLEIATTPGILYPDFPTEFLIQSASQIVNDLIIKGIIES